MLIKKLTGENIAEFRSLVEIFNHVFENNGAIVDATALKKLLDNPDFAVFVVLEHQQVIGGLTVYVLHSYYHPKPIAYIYDVGIHTPFQGKGYGKMLMKEVCKYFEQNGFDHAYVEAESDDVDAVQFYRKTPFTSELNAIHFTYDFDRVVK